VRKGSAFKKKPINQGFAATPESYRSCEKIAALPPDVRKGSQAVKFLKISLD
jgi:hypothetical protein